MRPRIQLLAGAPPSRQWHRSAMDSTTDSSSGLRATARRTQRDSQEDDPEYRPEETPTPEEGPEGREPQVCVCIMLHVDTDGQCSCNVCGEYSIELVRVCACLCRWHRWFSDGRSPIASWTAAVWMAYGWQGHAIVSNKIVIDAF